MARAVKPGFVTWLEPRSFEDHTTRRRRRDILKSHLPRRLGCFFRSFHHRKRSHSKDERNKLSSASAASSAAIDFEGVVAAMDLEGVVACEEDASSALALEGLVACKADEPGEPSEPGRPARRGPAKPKGPPPPRRSAAPPRSGLPELQWPGPTEDWMPDRKINWLPIRQVDRLEGSVWQQVRRDIETRGFQPLPRDDVNHAFLRCASEPAARRMPPPTRCRRAFPPSAALNADMVYAQLGKLGCADIADVAWVVGVPRQQPTPDKEMPIKTHRGHSRDCSRGRSSTDISGSDGAEPDSDTEDVQQGLAPLPEALLDKLLAFLHMAEGAEYEICREDEVSAPLAPPEEFMRKLIVQVSPLSTMQSRVRMALSIARFPAETGRLEEEIGLGLTSARAILGSRTLPVLLEGILTLGNYVNKGSSTLGAALGVVLNSLALVAHTRCRGGCREGRADAPQGPENALGLLVRQLQDTHGSSFLPSLLADLKLGSVAKDTDPAAIGAGIQRGETQVAAVRQKLEEALAGDAGAEPEALRARSLEAFLEQAQPQLAGLREGAAKLEAATADLRKYFAEPPESRLSGMLQSLHSLMRALPAPRPSSFCGQRGAAAAPKAASVAPRPATNTRTPGLRRRSATSGPLVARAPRTPAPLASPRMGRFSTPNLASAPALEPQPEEPQTEASPEAPSPPEVAPTAASAQALEPQPREPQTEASLEAPSPPEVAPTVAPGPALEPQPDEPQTEASLEAPSPTEVVPTAAPAPALEPQPEEPQTEAVPEAPSPPEVVPTAAPAPALEPQPEEPQTEAVPEAPSPPEVVPAAAPAQALGPQPEEPQTEASPEAPSPPEVVPTAAPAPALEPQPEEPQTEASPEAPSPPEVVPASAPAPALEPQPEEPQTEASLEAPSPPEVAPTSAPAPALEPQPEEPQTEASPEALSPPEVAPTAAPAPALEPQPEEPQTEASAEAPSPPEVAPTSASGPALEPLPEEPQTEASPEAPSPTEVAPKLAPGPALEPQPEEPQDEASTEAPSTGSFSSAFTTPRRPSRGELARLQAQEAMSPPKVSQDDSQLVQKYEWQEMPGGRWAKYGVFAELG